MGRILTALAGPGKEALYGAGARRVVSGIGDIFETPDVPTMPEVPPPPAIPEVGEEPGVSARRRARTRRGYRRTILTGKLAPQTGKKQFLGGK